MKIVLLLLILSLAGLTAAQDEDPTPAPPLDVPIQFDQIVTESITDFAIFDWWRINLSEGDEILVEMQAADGLSPLIGILDATQELVARSDDERPSEQNGLAIVQYRAETTGSHTIIATRDGNAQGITTGTYTLRVQRVDIIPDRENDRIEVEFRCDDMIVTTAAVIEFTEEPRAPDENGIVELYRLTVFGYGDFMPVIRVERLDTDERLDCSDDAQLVPGSSMTFPGEEALMITEDNVHNAARLTLRNIDTASSFGNLRFTIGSRDGEAGRYVAVLEGLALPQRNAADVVQVSTGPLGRDESTFVYMVGADDSRLDPFMLLLNEAGDILSECDDAGRGDCDTVPAFDGAEAVIAVGVCETLGGGCGDDLLTIEEVVIPVDRFDAGITLSGDIAAETAFLELSSRNNDTFGAYTLFITGEIPLRAAGE